MIATLLISAALAGEPTAAPAPAPATVPAAPVPTTPEAPAAPAAAASAAPPADGPAGDIYVSSVPTGAAVWVDGADTKLVTPTMVHVPAGEHQVDVRAACAHIVAPATVGNKTVTRLDLTVPADAPGTMVIASTPPGAFLSIDGVEAGSTPYVATVTCGAHDVSTVLAGYQAHTERLSVMAAESLKVDLILTKQEYGGLTVVPTPLDAIVSIDGNAQAAGPVTLDHLLAAPHDVSVVRDGYVAYGQPVTVPANDTVRLDVTLEPVGVPRRHLPFMRLGMDAAVTGVGVGFTSWGVFIYSQARVAYHDYLTMPGDDAADLLYDMEVAPRRAAVYINFGVGVPLLAVGGLMIATTHFGGDASDFRVSVGPNGASVSGRW